jgi:hypothetical protein
VEHYYSLLPGDTDTAWNLLTKRFQRTTAGGRASYDNYWHGVAAVEVTNARDIGPDAAEATITYRYESGKVSSEDTQFQFKDQGGVRKIDRTEVIGRG